MKKGKLIILIAIGLLVINFGFVLGIPICRTDADLGECCYEYTESPSKFFEEVYGVEEGQEESRLRHEATWNGIRLFFTQHNDISYPFIVDEDDTSFPAGVRGYAYNKGNRVDGYDDSDPSRGHIEWKNIYEICRESVSEGTTYRICDGDTCYTESSLDVTIDFRSFGYSSLQSGSGSSLSLGGNVIARAQGCGPLAAGGSVQGCKAPYLYWPTLGDVNSQCEWVTGFADYWEECKSGKHTVSSSVVVGNNVFSASSNNGGYDCCSCKCDGMHVTVRLASGNTLKSDYWGSKLMCTVGGRRYSVDSAYGDCASTSLSRTITVEEVGAGGGTQQTVCPNDQIIMRLTANNKDETGLLWDETSYEGATQEEIAVQEGTILRGISGDTLLWTKRIKTDRVRDWVTIQGKQHPLYWHYNAVLLQNLLTGQIKRTTPANEEKSILSPRISGNKVAYSKRTLAPYYNGGIRQIFLYDMLTNQETQITNHNKDIYYVEIEGDILAWADSRNKVDPDKKRMDLFFINISESLTEDTQITDGTVNPTWGSIFYSGAADISGDKIIFMNMTTKGFSTPSSTYLGTDIHEIYVYDITTGNTVEIPLDSSARVLGARIKGEILVWLQQHGVKSTPPFEIYSLNISAPSTRTLIKRSNSPLYLSAFSGAKVLWKQVDARDTWNVYATNLETQKDVQISFAKEEADSITSSTMDDQHNMAFQRTGEPYFHTGGDAFVAEFGVFPSQKVCYDIIFDGAKYGGADPHRCVDSDGDGDPDNLIVWLDGQSGRAAAPNAAGRDSAYNVPVCYGNLQNCKARDEACKDEEEEVAILKMSAMENAHLDFEDETGYDYTLCCGGGWVVVENVYWENAYGEKVTETSHGRRNYMVANASLLTEGGVVVFELWETEAGDDTKINETPYTITAEDVEAGEFSLEWMAKWFDDGPLQGDPEYYFKVVTRGGTHVSGELEVAPTGDNMVPNVVITGPIDGQLYRVGQDISFTHASTDDDGDMVKVEWSFGGNVDVGGEEASSFELANINDEVVGEYTSVGYKVIILTVTDDDGDEGKDYVVIGVLD